MTIERHQPSRELDLGGIAGLRLSPDELLAKYTTFRIGGPAEFFVWVETAAALRAVLIMAREQSLPFRLLGLGSNVLVPDEGISGIVARLTGEFEEVRIEERTVSAGGAVKLGRLARETARAGLSGLEALSGFPSTVGGAVVMNAGSYGSEIKDVLVDTTVMDENGEECDLTCAELEPGYRSTILQGRRLIVLQARFELSDGDPEVSRERIDDLNRRRRKSLPSGNPNAGSIFRNPEGDSAGRLIDLCGLKGSACGGAAISPEHANVIVNLGEARATDVLELMRRAYVSVLDRFGKMLEPEIVLTGSLRGLWEEMVAAAQLDTV